MIDVGSLNPRKSGGIAQADVPRDVWLEIVVHLEAPDVLSLQSVSSFRYPLGKELKYEFG
jgi:hypothetical protein